ncbi:hypothetical protein SADUNF_Sadunf09G0115300 [Salix dunnii]|uniref:Uncharacterized protein n=1 Tax=Salix dunnii TaxID=1413687 RepID=A0A835JRL7_9ROSI|nr:hypothetical protein SADUNF_Sadunf09G0115300 [Salix dunnii]
MFPIPYLDNNIVGELLVISEEEFGLPRGGPITLPLMQSPWNIVDKEMEKAVLMSVISSRSCSLSSCPGQGQTSQRSLAYSFRESDKLNLIL